MRKLPISVSQSARARARALTRSRLLPLALKSRALGFKLELHLRLVRGPLGIDPSELEAEGVAKIELLVFCEAIVSVFADRPLFLVKLVDFLGLGHRRAVSTLCTQVWGVIQRGVAAARAGGGGVGGAFRRSLLSRARVLSDAPLPPASTNTGGERPSLSHVAERCCMISVESRFRSPACLLKRATQRFWLCSPCWAKYRRVSEHKRSSTRAAICVSISWEPRGLCCAASSFAMSSSSCGEKDDSRGLTCVMRRRVTRRLESRAARRKALRASMTSSNATRSRE